MPDIATPAFTQTQPGSTWFSRFFTPQVVIQIITLLLGAGIAWGALKAQVSGMTVRITDLENQAPTAKIERIDARLSNMERQNAVIESETRHIRELLELHERETRPTRR